MHTNYYFLKALAARLDAKLTGWVIGTCFSQEKDEVVIGFYADRQEFYIKAVMQPDFATLVFYDEFRRAKQNSVDLFSEMYGCQVQQVVGYKNERAFGILLENGFLLVFKLFGNRSNLLLFQEGAFKEMFRHKLIADQHLTPAGFHRRIDQTFQNFAAQGFSIQKIYPTFGKIILQYIESQHLNTPEATWEFVQDLVGQLIHPQFYITQLPPKPRLAPETHLLLLPLGNIQFQTDDPLEAANRFYGAYARINFFEKERNAVLRSLEKRKAQTENYLLKGYEKRSELENESRNEQFANILMANLHVLETGMEKAELYDFYHDKPIVIKLKKDLSPQKNAEIYYRKAKNSGIEIQKLRQILTAKEAELLKIEERLTELATLDNLKTLRKYLKDNGLDNEKNNPDLPDLFKSYNYLGFEIKVGKNAKNNDLLLQRYAYKEDLWLHAKDVTGSHVIIKYQAGKTFPEPVIEKAAGLAAWYSKNRKENLCAVIVTPKKYVRKTKDLVEGQVIVEKETVLLVEPCPPPSLL